ncbi:MAG: ABC transporter ATP-binding protein [Acidobacteria bacterium]|nr:MAG: ABC transporter ATP-binding protein [Acidobacteriota bacterium]
MMDVRGQPNTLSIPLLVAEDVWFRFHRPVLVSISLELRRGELVALIGPNGSGKTTLLRLLRNRLRPQRGRVLLKGKPIERYSRKALARTIGYVLQDHRVGFPLTVAEYVLQARFAHARGWALEGREDVEAARWALRVTDAVAFSDRRVDELSGGERQRVILARALAGQPEILLLDEPTANMDLAYQVDMLRLIKRLTRERSWLSVFVTHELNLATEFADRIILLKDGRILGCGRPTEVLTPERLSAAFGCAFLVDINPISGAPRVSIAT